jgi:NADH-quinone oxidoreductase subunit M
MNYVIIGIILGNNISLIGSYFTLISHGIISSILFILIGILYRRYHTRNIYNYRGLYMIMPVFSAIFIFYIINNLSIPLTIGFIGEFTILLGIMGNN